ncbi:MAG: GlsB/YeaQ/YmgE family stress response membrane protein [Streptosporangiales bacterium]|nr:GlsB/YeaQ/YmgE family stress response membrane protein [Streptosporangiales bacterium]
MEISGIISAVVIGIVLGFGGKLLAPGRQKIKWWLTILVGIAAALVGTFLAGVLGVASTPRIDWIELIIQFVLAAIGVSLVAGAAGRKR